VADVFTKKKRSQVMAAIRSTGNRATELRLAAIFRAHGITGWRRHQALPGKPDFVFRRERLAVFVDGCFWHGCRWHCRMPKSRRAYWGTKIARNKARDAVVRKVLRAIRHAKSESKTGVLGDLYYVECQSRHQLLAEFEAGCV
jgi:DNA mismatch endonuclease (patch repair protein)